MRSCPHYVDGQTAHAASLCVGGRMPFEPSASVQTEWCLTGWHDNCRLYRTLSAELSQAIHQEVIRAVG